MASMPDARAAETPPSHEFPGDTAVVQKGFAGPEREFIDGVGREVVANIEDAGALVARQTIDVLRSIRFATTNGAVVDGVGPGVTALEGKAAIETALKRDPQGVIA